MNPIKNLFKFNRGKVKSQTNFIGRTSIGLSNPGKYMGLDLHSDTYASAYPSIRAISNEYMTVLPKAIDGNGKPVKSNILDALYHPNQKDSVVSFNEKLATSTLVLPQTYILVWRSEGGVAKPGGDFGFKGRNIAGFTFLENPGVSQRDGKIYYNIGSQWFTEDEVLVLPGGVDPHNLYGGYSPTEAACRWITLDDYIADFQKGFFENNAIPAGMFKISAATPTEFEDIVSNLKRRHKGVGNNNNVTYSHAPVDPNTGKTAEAKIEWIPFQQSNKDIDFKSLFEQANHRIDQAYGVPAIVKGIDDAATYANAQVAEAGFAKRAVKPLLTRNYAQLTHELNRITGGMGIALTFDYEIPAIADEEKVVAETRMIEANLIRTLTLEGYSLDTIVDAFKLSNGYKLLKKDQAPAVIENDKPQVDEGNEVSKSPDPDVIDGVTPVARGSERTNPKAELTDEERIESIALKLMRSQVQDAINALDNTQAVATDEQIDTFVDEALVVLLAIVIAYGISQNEEGIALLSSLGLSTELVKDFSLSDEQRTRYRQYLKGVGTSYSQQTTQAIQNTLERANIEGWTAQEIKKELNRLPEIEGYRAKRIARTETVKAGGNGSLYSMEQIASETGYDIYKVWNINTDACEYCQAMRGTSTRVTEAFIPVGGSVTADDGTMLINNWQDVEVAQLHPNCTCFMTYEIR